MDLMRFGDYLLPPDAVLEVKEKDLKVTTQKRTSGSSFFDSLFGGSYEKHSSIYRVWVLRVDAKAFTPRSNGLVYVDIRDADDGFSRPSSPFITQVYDSYTIYNDPQLLTDAQSLLKATEKPELRDAAISTLCDLGMDRTLYGWLSPDYLETHMLLDESLKTKADVMAKYIDWDK